jgi:hypothetical protein
MLLARTVATCCVLVGAAGGLASWGGRLAADGLSAARTLPEPTPDTASRLVTGVAGVGLAATGAWLALVVAVCAVDVALGRSHRAAAGPLRPRRVRSLVLRVCAPAVGAALACGVVLPATATASEGPAEADRAGGTGATAARLSGLPLPMRPLSPVSTVAVSREEAPVPTVRVVRAGDSLWSIAADELGPRAGMAAVDRAWRALHRRNLGRIGADPDVLLPGTRLRLPNALTFPPTSPDSDH